MRVFWISSLFLLVFILQIPIEKTSEIVQNFKVQSLQRDVSHFIHLREKKRFRSMEKYNFRNIINLFILFLCVHNVSVIVL